MMRRVIVEGKRRLSVPAAELRGVSARYTEGLPSAVSDVNLEVAAGELLAVLGPNGAGKSTLLRVLAGTLAPTAGEALLFGKRVDTSDRGLVARTVAVVPQFDEVAFGFTVREVVLMGRAPHQSRWMTPSVEDEREVDKALERCDLGGFATRIVDQLSGGERKRVSIARALAQTPKVLLLDEPGAFLDVKHQLALYDLLTTLVAEEKIAAVVSMHDLNAAAQYASRVTLMKDGRIVATGTVPEVMTYRRLQETFDADLYCGVNDVNGARFFLPMRKG